MIARSLLSIAQFGQLRDINRNPSRLVFGEQLGRRAPSRLILKIDIGERLPRCGHARRRRRLVRRRTTVAGSGGQPKTSARRCGRLGRLQLDHDTARSARHLPEMAGPTKRPCCSIECWFKSKGLRVSSRRFGRACANRKTAWCPSGNQVRPIARFDGRNCRSGR